MRCGSGKREEAKTARRTGRSRETMKEGAKHLLITFVRVVVETATRFERLGLDDFY
jgi:hypothetical protein